MGQPTTWPTWLAALFVTSLCSFCMGFSLHWAISQGSVQPAEASPAGIEESTPGALIAEVDAPPAEDGFRAARHLFVGIHGQHLSDDAREFIRTVRPRGVVLRSENIQSPAQVLQLVRDLKAAGGAQRQRFSDSPLVILHDPAEAGRNLNWHEPMMTSYAVSFADADAATQASRALAQACAEMGVGALLGPSLAREARPLTAGFTSGGTGTGTQLSNLGKAYAEGLMAGGVLPIVKHFPHGSAVAGFGSRLSGGVNELAGAMLPFEESVAQGVPGILVGHGPVPELDQNDPDRPASQSPLIVTSLLRERWGFGGVVVAEDITQRAATGSRTIEETALGTFAAGCDVALMLDPSEERIRAVCSAVESAVQSGMLDRRAFDAASRRIDAWEAWLDRPLPEAARTPAPQTQRPSNSMLSRSFEPQPEAPQIVPPRTPDSTTEEPAAAEEDWVQPMAAPPEEAAPVAETPVESTPEPVVDAEESDAPPIAEVNTEEPASVEAQVAETPATEPEPQADESATASAAEEDTEEASTPVETPEEEIVVASEPVADEPVVEMETPEIEADAPASEEPAPSDAPAETLSEPTTMDAPEEVPAIDREEFDDAPEASDEVDAAAEDETPEPPVAGAEESDEIIHVVVAGDTLSGIAARYGVSMDDIKRWNDMEDNQVNLNGKLIVHAGSTKAAPVPEAAVETKSYEIKTGDTLIRIAREFNVTVEGLLKLNELDDANQITVGQKIKIPN